MTRISKQLISRRGFDYLAGIHDYHAVGHTGNNAKVVRNQNHRRSKIATHTVNQFENLRLYGDIQRGRWLIGNQQFGVTGQGNGDHHTLAHSSTELVRIGVYTFSSRGNADLL